MHADPRNPLNTTRRKMVDSRYQGRHLKTEPWVHPELPANRTMSLLPWCPLASLARACGDPKAAGPAADIPGTASGSASESTFCAGSNSKVEKRDVLRVIDIARGSADHLPRHTGLPLPISLGGPMPKACTIPEKGSGFFHNSRISTGQTSSSSSSDTATNIVHGVIITNIDPSTVVSPGSDHDSIHRNTIDASRPAAPSSESLPLLPLPSLPAHRPHNTALHGRAASDPGHATHATRVSRGPPLEDLFHMIGITKKSICRKRAFYPIFKSPALSRVKELVAAAHESSRIIGPYLESCVTPEELRICAEYGTHDQRSDDDERTLFGTANGIREILAKAAMLMTDVVNSQGKWNETELCWPEQDALKAALPDLIAQLEGYTTELRDLLERYGIEIELAPGECSEFASGAFRVPDTDGNDESVRKWSIMPKRSMWVTSQRLLTGSNPLSISSRVPTLLNLEYHILKLRYSALPLRTSSDTKSAHQIEISSNDQQDQDTIERQKHTDNEPRPRVDVGQHSAITEAKMAFQRFQAKLSHPPDSHFRRFRSHPKGQSNLGAAVSLPDIHVPLSRMIQLLSFNLADVMVADISSSSPKNDWGRATVPRAFEHTTQASSSESYPEVSMRGGELDMHAFDESSDGDGALGEHNITIFPEKLMMHRVGVAAQARRRRNREDGREATV
ncbi:hypothetical protein BJ170DRAFT_595171 [Xylariales sp. AK1849]|nr:hypothetical protein BJ170DRAFT_595171 [Xylariales sp. AK1849]